MQEIDDFIPVTKAKAKMLDIIRDIDINDNTIAITKNGLPCAVIMSMEHYYTIHETLAILADTDTLNQIRSSIKEIQVGEPLVDFETIA